MLPKRKNVQCIVLIACKVISGKCIHIIGGGGWHRKRILERSGVGAWPISMLTHDQCNNVQTLYTPYIHMHTRALRILYTHLHTLLHT